MGSLRPLPARNCEKVDCRLGFRCEDRAFFTAARSDPIPTPQDRRFTEQGRLDRERVIARQIPGGIDALAGKINGIERHEAKNRSLSASRPAIGLNRSADSIHGGDGSLAT